VAGIRNHEDMVAWQLCRDLKDRIYALTAAGPAWRDLKFRHQIRDAACSAMDRLSEGFYRYYSRDFARFCSMTRGSLGEIKNQVRHGQSQKYWTPSEFNELWSLTRRAMAATTNLHNYLRKCDPR
jgi:four helix bundle protein